MKLRGIGAVPRISDTNSPPRSGVRWSTGTARFLDEVKSASAIGYTAHRSREPSMVYTEVTTKISTRSEMAAQLREFCRTSSRHIPPDPPGGPRGLEEDGHAAGRSHPLAELQDDPLILAQAKRKKRGYCSITYAEATEEGNRSIMCGAQQCLLNC